METQSGMDGRWEQISPDSWKPASAGDMIEGTLINIRENVGKFAGKSYCLEKDGKQTIVFGTTVLDDRMSYVKVGDYIKIEFKGLVKNKKEQDTKIYNVYRAK